jgi:RimJ/RimL family protein N-acetyltransferase
VRHDLRPEGSAFRLRPVESSDAAFLAALRSDPRAAGRLHPTSGLIDDQIAWIGEYLVRPDDWYWIVERRADGHSEGALGLWRTDEASGRAQWGRWILRPGSLAAPESVLLLYRAAFEDLNLREVYCRTVTSNLAVVSFHDRVGLRRVGMAPAAFQFGEIEVDAVEHCLACDAWPAARDLLERSALATARFIAREASR